MTRSTQGGHELRTRVAEALAGWRDAPAWHVGFSGGLDSTVLLHLLADLARQQTIPRLHAIHIHHGLQAVADDWPAHCRRICDALGVPLQIVQVSVSDQGSLEQAARHARYAAFGGLLGRDELILTGQHQDDQAETVLFRLLRGAGVRGLAGMPAQRPLGKGWLVRPLLSASRKELERYAQRHGLSWIEDPSNDHSCHARNFLRNQVMPQLTDRWPQASANMARAAGHLAEAQALLDELAMQDLRNAQPTTSYTWLGLPVLALAPIAGLSAARQRNALRHWLAPLSRLPDTDHWAGWENLRDAGTAAQPVWRLADGELHRAENHLWWLSNTWHTPTGNVPPWLPPYAQLDLPDNGHVTISGDAPAGSLHVRYRQGGEVMQVPGRGHRDLKRLLSERGVPTFVRGRLPLLYAGDQLVAVANLPGLDGSAHGNWRLHWVAPTSDQCLS
jgi:tRNA(Ile)-lysidine synthase